MKKIIIGVVFFLSGFFSVLLIKLSSIDNPVSNWSDQTRFEAFLEEWNIGILYQLSIWLVAIGVLLILIEPVLVIYRYIKQNVKRGKTWR
ncbi:MAG: hypothetical protein KKH01_08020 [Firmicutes bacterium]|nr:hypothetical protein [Bacillota bacterium]